MLPFLKMHGAGNDFVLLDQRANPVDLSLERVAALADRRRGIGFDQLILVEESRLGADAAMRIRNADGSHSGACGNAARCVAWLIARETGRSGITLETDAGLLPSEFLDDGQVRVDMGAPRLGWREIPLAHEMDTLRLEIAGEPAAVSMGNPHVTCFVDDLAITDVEGIGRGIEQDALFPDRVNVGFAQIMAPATLKLRVWERGAGLTLACGSGACAALVNAHRRGLMPREARILLDGGTLDICWRASDGHVLMTGPVATAFRGEIDLSGYPA